MKLLKLTRSVAVALYEVLLKMLFSDMEKGTERELPLSIKYKLKRSLVLLEKDYKDCLDKKSSLIAENGVLDEEKGIYTLDENNKEVIEKVQRELQEFMSQPLEHSITKLLPEELDYFKDTCLSSLEVDIVLTCLVEDPNLEKELGLTE